MLLIGSHALATYLDNPGEYLRGRAPDYDYICTIEDYEQWVKINRPDEAYPVNGGKSMVAKLRAFDSCIIYEFSIAWPGSTNGRIMDMEHPIPFGTDTASLNMLLLIKLSHRYKKNSPHFHKTMYDIQLLRSLGANVSGAEMKQLLKDREEETYNYASPSLKQGKKTFFSDVDKFYKYEHDDIHVAVATGERPAYKEFAKDGEEVLSSRKLFMRCPYMVQLAAGLEESYVLAIERSLVPHPGVLTRRQAFNHALMKVCTSITSGWFREFCWENYDAIMSMYNDDYFDKFTAALEAGKIREYGGAEGYVSSK